MKDPKILLSLVRSQEEAEKAHLKDLYFSAFPQEERRPWELMFKGDPQSRPQFYEIEYVADDDRGSLRPRVKSAGFVTLWDLDGVTYVEHFAVFPELRSHGIGRGVLQTLQELPNSLILEVEKPESSSEADRRISFYLNNGFRLSDLDYIQPPYTPDLAPVEMRLMTSGEIEDIRHIVKILHNRVYKVMQ